MFCKICFDAGRDGFNTHNIRDYAGNITCNYLSNIKCSICGEFGHTVKYCKATSPYVKPIVSLETKITKVVKKSNMLNQFALLCDESSQISDSDPDDDDFDLGEFTWGVGFHNMVGKSWADLCD